MLCKGEVLKDFIGKNSTVIWNMDENGCATWIYVIEKEMLSDFKIHGHYDFACVKEEDIIFLCIKSQKGGWFSAPFSPHLTSSYNHQIYPKGDGKPLTILIVNNRTGKIEDMDLMALGTDFSNYIEEQAKNLSKKNFDLSDYQNSIQRAYQKYPTDEDMVSVATMKYSID
ncbi:MAG: hypothetical protein RR063_11300 [Anaerovoracaceae bacterium]